MPDLQIDAYPRSKKMVELNSTVVHVNITNKSQKDAQRGSVSMQNSASGDTQIVSFGYIRGQGGTSSGSAYLNGAANIVIAQFFADDDSDWVQTGSAPGAGTTIINIGLNDAR